MNAIEVNDITKKFKVYYDKGRSFKEKLLFQNRNRYEERWVLKGVSFDVKKGEAVGLVGENGCGKSTLLKLMTKILYPDSGVISIQGRVSSLIELGAGFHPDMSGKENIYTNASIFGLTRKEIDARLQKIIAFSGLQEFIDNPVRTYSSGMYTRLAFAVAINVDADILLVDEILSVGDANFQAKCFNKMQEIKKQGTTIVIVSHDMNSIERLCDRAIWIKDGLIAEEGTPRAIVCQYIDSIMNKSVSALTDGANEEAEKPHKTETDNPQQTFEDDKNEDKVQHKNEIGNKFVEITGITQKNLRSTENTNIYRMGDTIQLAISYKRNNNDIEGAAAGIRIYRADGLDCFGSNTVIDNNFTIPLKNKGTITLDLQNIPFLQGEFTADIAIHSATGQTYHHISEALSFNVYSINQEVGLVHVDHDWVY